MQPALFQLSGRCASALTHASTASPSRTLLSCLLPQNDPGTHRGRPAPPTLAPPRRARALPALLSARGLPRGVCGAPCRRTPSPACALPAPQGASLAPQVWGLWGKKQATVSVASTSPRDGQVDHLSRRWHQTKHRALPPAGASTHKVHGTRHFHALPENAHTARCLARHARTAREKDPILRNRPYASTPGGRRRQPACATASGSDVRPTRAPCRRGRICRRARSPSRRRRRRDIAHQAARPPIPATRSGRSRMSENIMSGRSS